MSKHLEQVVEAIDANDEENKEIEEIGSKVKTLQKWAKDKNEIC